MNRFVVACCVVFSMAGLAIADPATQPATQTQPATTTAPATKAATQASNLQVETALAGVIGGFTTVEQIITLTPEEKTKSETLLEKVKDEARKNPNLVLTDAARNRFAQDVERRYRAILTPANLKALDDHFAKEKLAAIQKGSQANVAILAESFKRFADENNGKFPSGIGEMIEKGYSSPTDYLRQGATRVPQEVFRTQRNQQAAWTVRASEFVYIGAGKDRTKIDPKFVIIYDKEGTAFGCASGTMANVDLDMAAKIFAELKAGKNPPPSLLAK